MHLFLFIIVLVLVLPRWNPIDIIEVDNGWILICDQIQGWGQRNARGAIPVLEDHTGADRPLRTCPG
jgi:hypothetical protein